MKSGEMKSGEEEMEKKMMSNEDGDGDQKRWRRRWWDGDKGAKKRLIKKQKHKFFSLFLKKLEL